MANPPNIIRKMVSGQRIRFTEDGYNLDLSYIGDRIIAMGYPADNVESIYRNKRGDVVKFLKEKHPGCCKVYNLCSERTYDSTLFPHYAEYPFKDHNPPDIELINKFCEDVDTFLRSDSRHVVAIHCKAGKGRTGTMICCYLLYSNAFQTANEALTYYAEKRTKDKKGVTIPSQRRYVEYYEQLLRGKPGPYQDVTLYICEIHISPADVPLKSGTIKVKGSKEAHPLTEFQRSEDHVTVQLNFCLPLTGDVKIEFARSKLQDKRWHFWFNTFFVERAGHYDSQNRLVLSLTKKEIDDAHKGNAKNCPEQVIVFLRPVPSSERKNGEKQSPANRELSTIPTTQQAPLVDSGNQNHHHQYYSNQQQLQQRHQFAQMESITQSQQQLLAQQPQQQHRSSVNNRSSMGSGQLSSCIYGNIGHPDSGGLLSIAKPMGMKQQQQQHHHQAVYAVQQPDMPHKAPQQQQSQPQQHNHSGGSSEEISGTDSEGWESGECQTVVSDLCKSRPTATSTTTTPTDENYLLTGSRCLIGSGKGSGPLPPAGGTPADENCRGSSMHSFSNNTNSRTNFVQFPPRSLPSTDLLPVKLTGGDGSSNSGADGDHSSGTVFRRGQSLRKSIPPGTTGVGERKKNDHRELMLYEPRSSFLPFPSGGASVLVENYDDHELQESHILLSPPCLPNSLPKGSSPSNATVLIGTSGRADGAAASGGSKLTTTWSSPASSSLSPFRRFGMAMKRRKKKRGSLKLKHGGGGAAVAVTIGAGTGGSNPLYGSCASNLSALSGGKGSEGRTRTNSGSAGGVANSGSGNGGRTRFRLLRNMRSNPSLKETLVKSVKVRPVEMKHDERPEAEPLPSSSCATQIPRSPTTTIPSGSGSSYARSTPDHGGRRPATEGGTSSKEIASSTSNTNHPTDYYSFLCDNQLSYESPSKSPGHFLGGGGGLMGRRPSTIEEVLLSDSTATTTAAATVECSVVVKPRATNVKIGFDVGPPAPSSPVTETDAAAGSPTLESSFEIIDKCDIDDAMSVKHDKTEPPTTDQPFGGEKTEATSSFGDCRQIDARCAFSSSETQARRSVERSASTPSSGRPSVVNNGVLTAATANGPEDSNSPILARSNRCAPFSFREIRQELRAAMKLPPKRTQSAALAPTVTADSSSVLSIERTLSAPVEVQSLRSVTTTTTTGSTPNSSTFAEGSVATLANRPLNRSLSERQLGKDRTDRLSKKC
ncbi:mucin-17 [Anopheles bellator]|uniref:mucin-17 n=1 Tax=Anopheles bellator TaxID=139047 RepID=UPI002649416E|nr:mucin-17 [Anopheles bellator]